MTTYSIPETHGQPDPRNLPYRIIHSPQTGEVFIMTTNMNVIMAFLNTEAAERFSEELQMTLFHIKPKILQDAERILQRHLPPEN